MSNLNILSENLIKDSSIDLSMISGSENTNFPLLNIPHNFTTKMFRSNENECEILVDFKQNRAIDIFCVAGNNITGLGVTNVTVTLSATSDFTGLTEYDVEMSMVNSFGYIEIPEQVARFVRIKLSNTGGYCELSNIFIGKQIKFEYNGLSQQGFRFGVNDNSTIRSNEYGQDYANKRNQTKFLTGQVRFANKLEIDYLDEIITRHIDRSPLWVIIDGCDNFITDSKFRLSGYYSVSNSPSFSNAGAGLFNVSLNFKEVV